MHIGAEDLSTGTLENSYQVLAVEKRGFIPIFMMNDIALMKVSYNGSAPKVPIATQPVKVADCEIGGFGSPSFNAPVSNQFLVARIGIVPISTCIRQLGFFVVPSIAGSVLCVGGSATDTCQGDSGSGLMCNGLLVGITSFG